MIASRNAISVAELCRRHLVDVEAHRPLTRRKIAKKESLQPMKGVGPAVPCWRLRATQCASPALIRLSTEPGTRADSG